MQPLAEFYLKLKSLSLSARGAALKIKKVPSGKGTSDSCKGESHGIIKLWAIAPWEGIYRKKDLSPSSPS